MRCALAILLVSTGTASAAGIQTRGPESFPGKHELTAQMGFQAGFGGKYSNPSGFKLSGEYGYRFSDVAWFNAQLNHVFGFGGGICFDRQQRSYGCGYGGGFALEVMVGVKLKIKTPIPLVVEIPLLGGLEVLYNRDCSDGGAAVPVFRAGAGVKYFLTRNIGVGGGPTFAFGPAFHGKNNCGNGDSYVDLFGAFDFMVGGEFIF